MCDEYNIQTLITSTFAVGFIIHGFVVFFKDYTANMADYCSELARPWKLATLAAGLSWLLFGALTYGFQDWDVGVSLIMAGLTYISAPWCVRKIMNRRWSMIVGVIIMSWFSIDGAYALWHNFVGNEMIRDANFPASAALYWLCGFILLPRGSLKDICSRRAQLR